MSNKTISINPNLFTLGKKTKKTEKKKKINKPLISPNILKNKLLNRIKEHKKKETSNLENNKPKNIGNIGNTDNNTTDSISFTDEFNDSLNYLQSLSKEKKNKDNKQKYLEDLERKTIRNYASLNKPSIDKDKPIINVDLPEELQEIKTDTFIANELKDKSNTDTALPYGILKGGTKPTYREWQKTQRYNIVTNPNSALIIDISNRDKTEREQRLNKLREKLKTNEINKELIKAQDTLTQDTNLITPNVTNIQLPMNIMASSIANEVTNNNILINEPNETNNETNNEKIIATKKITKKTIKKKYTLGKSKLKKVVSILIKDRNTRKQILNAQKELKKKPINEIKTHLKEHNLIKIGSEIPNDVARKMYESAMMTGEITNTNSETLLHNILKDEALYK